MTDKATEPSESSWNPRSRPVVSCLNCRRKKQKCDRQLPCNSCIRSGKPSSCQYAPRRGPVSDGSDEESRNSKRQCVDGEHRSSVVPVVSLVTFNKLQDQVNRLEDALRVQQQQLNNSTNGPRIDDEAPRNTVFDSSSEVKQKKTDELCLYKPLRLQFPDLQLCIERLKQKEPSDEIRTVAADLCILSKLFDKPRTHDGSFRIYSSISDVLDHMERLLPSQSDCDVLIDLYFQTFENSLRVLHSIVRTEFRAFFQGRLVDDQRITCIPKLLAAVSMGASLETRPECANPELHGLNDGPGAYELLRNYLVLLTEKQWKQLPNLQIAVLSLKSHKSSMLSSVQAWQWSGEVLRRAMVAGIHQLPSHGMMVYDQEIRRRLWLTTLELDLTYAIASNMPATCPAWEHEAPLSIDDSRLHPLMERLPTTGGPEVWTDGICQHALAQSFNDRREAYALVSADKSPLYTTVLLHTRHLEQVIHDLPRVFGMGSTSDQESDSPYRLMAKMELDFLLRRPLNACYAIYGAETSLTDAFREARIPWVQGCCYNMCFQDLFDPNYPTLDLPSPEGLWDFYYKTYKWDVHRFFLSNCLELQRLWLLDRDAVDAASQSFQGHTSRAPVKIMGWTIGSMIKSLEDTIGPEMRRLGRHASDFGNVMRWVAIIGALRASPTCSRLHSMTNELQDLVSTLYARRARNDAVSIQRSITATSHMTDKSNLDWLIGVLSENEPEHNMDC